MKLISESTVKDCSNGLKSISPVSKKTTIRERAIGAVVRTLEINSIAIPSTDSIDDELLRVGLYEFEYDVIVSKDEIVTMFISTF